MSARRTVAVLAVQGAFAEHERRLGELGCSVVELRQGADVGRAFDGLVLPGGESTAQAKLLRDLGMFAPLKALIQEGMPVLGTCAGLILLAQRVEGQGDAAGLPSEQLAKRTPVSGFATLPVTVSRNAYGRQLGSFHAEAPLRLGGNAETNGNGEAGRRMGGETPMIPLTFIRAPRIEATGDGVDTLVELDGRPVAVRWGNQMACSFHPELDPNPTIHQLFLDLI